MNNSNNNLHRFFQLNLFIVLINPLIIPLHIIKNFSLFLKGLIKMKKMTKLKGKNNNLYNNKWWLIKTTNRAKHFNKFFKLNSTLPKKLTIYILKDFSSR